MPEGTKQQLIDAAAELISASPEADVPLRVICDKVGVRLPTLYHHFGSKKGLIDAVIRYGFDKYRAAKESQEASSDPLVAIRNGWDTHVRFGLDNPSFYALMYGRIEPGQRTGPAQEPYALLLGLVTAAAAQGRLKVTPRQAVDHILAANIGVTLYLISEYVPDLTLSTSVRDATISAISSDAFDEQQADLVAQGARTLSAALEVAPPPRTLRSQELSLLHVWLNILSGDNASGPPVEAKVADACER